jgi:hypothetical protein
MGSLLDELQNAQGVSSSRKQHFLTIEGLEFNHSTLPSVGFYANFLLQEWMEEIHD